MKEILNRLNEALDLVISKDSELSSKISGLAETERAIRTKEEFLQGLERHLKLKKSELEERESKIGRAEEILAQGKALTHERNSFQEEKEKEEAGLRGIRLKLEDEKNAVNASRVKLEERELALSEEKENYKKRLKEELVSQLK